MIDVIACLIVGLLAAGLLFLFSGGLGGAAWSLLRACARRVCTFLAPAAFEERSRSRERKRLVAELEEFDAQRDYIEAREPRVLARLQTLARLDMQAALPQWSPTVQVPKGFVPSFLRKNDAGGNFAAPPIADTQMRPPVDVISEGRPPCRLP